MKLDIKTIKRAERVFKGAANKNRLLILDYISSGNMSSVWAISQNLNLDFRNTSQHLQRLEKAGLIDKNSVLREVWHTLTPYGEKVLKFIKTIS